MNLKFKFLGFTISSVELNLHPQLNDFSDAVETVEKRGKRLVGKGVDKFSTTWIKWWAQK